jgi:inorganic pyrophosphatase
VDVVEIGSRQLAPGEVYRVKPLGAYAMIDDGELDWKIVCVCVDDPLAPVLHDIEDVER